MSLRIEQVVTSGIFSLDGDDFDVDNNIWLLGDDEEGQKVLDELSMKKKKVFDEFEVEEEEGEQSMATKPFLGQIKAPSNF